MQTEKYRNIIKLTFGLGMIFIILTMITFWNSFLFDKEAVGILPFFFFILSIITLVYMFSLILKLTNPVKLESYISERLNEEKLKIISELNTEDEEEQEDKSSENIDIQEIISSLSPGSKFKKADTYSKKLLSNLANQFNLGQAILYKGVPKTKKFSFVAGYGLTNEEPIPDFTIGEGLHGEAALSKEPVLIDEIPADYFEMVTGLGSSKPMSLILLPILEKEKTISIIEMAAFNVISESDLKILESFSKSISNNLNQLFKA